METRSKGEVGEIGIEHGERVRRNAERSAAIASAFIFFFTAAAAKAEVTCKKMQPGHSLEIQYQKNETEQPLVVRIVHVKDAGKNLTIPKTPPPLFNFIQNTRLNFDNVNEGIADEASYSAFIDAEILKVGPSIGVSLNDLPTLDPTQLFLLSAAITNRNLHYDNRLVPPSKEIDNPIFDVNLSVNIAATPTDHVLQVNKIGICANFSQAVEEVAERIKQESKSPKLHTSVVRKLYASDPNHAWDALFIFGEEQHGGVAVSVLEISTLDVSVERESKNGEKKFIPTFLDAFDTVHESARAAYENYIFPSMGATDKRGVLKCLFDFQELGYPNSSILDTIFTSYKDDIFELIKQGDEGGARNLFSEMLSYGLSMKQKLILLDKKFQKEALNLKQRKQSKETVTRCMEKVDKILGYTSFKDFTAK